MPTIITHSVVAGSAAYGFRSGKESLKFWILSIICSSLPDADVIGYRWFYVPSYELFGHRGFFHSPIFAVLLGIVIVCIFYRKEAFFSNGSEKKPETRSPRSTLAEGSTRRETVAGEGRGSIFFEKFRKKPVKRSKRSTLAKGTARRPFNVL